MKWISTILFIAFIGSNDLFAQYTFLERDYTLLDLRLQNELQDDDESEEREEYPTPRSVLFKSMMIPGWGQIENRQIWKVPIIYGLFAGIGVYTVNLHDQ